MSRGGQGYYHHQLTISPNRRSLASQFRRSRRAEGLRRGVDAPFVQNGSAIAFASPLPGACDVGVVFAHYDYEGTVETYYARQRMQSTYPSPPKRGFYGRSGWVGRTYLPHESTPIVDAAAIYTHLDDIGGRFPDLSKAGVIERLGVDAADNVDDAAAVTCLALDTFTRLYNLHPLGADMAMMNQAKENSPLLDRIGRSTCPLGMVPR